MGIAADIALILVAALVGGITAHLLRQPLLVGYILAGILVGPNTIGPTVVEIHDIELLAEIGVALLLFALSLEVSFADLKPVRKLAVVGGSLQIILTTVFGYVVGTQVFGLEPQSAVWFGALISFSSTMVVLKTLMARGVMDTLASRAMIGILIIQDLALVPMLILLPKIGDLTTIGSELGRALVKGGLFLTAMTLVGTRLMPRLLRIIAGWRSRELFIVTVVALGIGIGYGTYLFGLSFAFGAFVAGMVLSESEFAHQALGDIIPLRDVFGMLFFASAGMLFDPRFLADHLAAVATTVALVVIGKGVLLSGLTLLLGERGYVPLAVGLGLSQVGEFSFVLAREGQRAGFLSNDLYALVLTTTLITMVLTPFLQRSAHPIYSLYRRIRPRDEEAELRSLPDEELSDHVVLVGFGQTGLAVSRVMEQSGVPYVVVETDHARFTDAATSGAPSIWGDATLTPVLEAAHVDRARLLLVTTPDAAGAKQVVREASQMNPQIVVIARARYRSQMATLRDAGVEHVVIPEVEAGLEMVRQVLSWYQMPASEILRFSDAVHREVYEPMLGGRLSVEGLHALEDLRRVSSRAEIDWVTVSETSSIAGRSIGNTDLRRATGASIVAIRGEHGLLLNPSADESLVAGSVVGLLGTSAERSAARSLIEG